MNTPLSYVEVSAENLRHNVAQFRRFLKPGTQIAAVVKGNGYGHGQPEVTGVLEDAVDYFQVDDLNELERLRATSAKPTLVLGYVARHELERALQLGCELAIYDTERLPILEELAERLQLTPRLHLKIDTYLGRQGLLVHQLDDFFEALARYPRLHLEGLYSHFANIEDTTDFSHAQKQIDTFAEALAVARQHGHSALKTHLASTSGALAYEQDNGHNPLVRLGIGVYGMWPAPQLQEQFPSVELRPSLRWISHLAQVKMVPADFPVGYGLTHITDRETRLAIVPQGYSDGYSRGFSNRSFVLIGGTRCKVLGRIAMNMFTVDVSHLPNLKAEEEVVLLGSQGQEKITAEELAAIDNTINYEITTRISPLLPRLVN